MHPTEINQKALAGSLASAHNFVGSQPTQPPAVSITHSTGSLNERLLMIENAVLVVMNTLHPIPSASKDRPAPPQAGVLNGLLGAHETVGRIEAAMANLCDLIGVIR